MKAPEKAMILAAGYGTRMLPLSLNKPKPLMPFWGKPVVAHLLETLIRWGVKDVVINLHHRPDPIVQYIRKTRFKDLKINLSFERELLGTGGALRQARWFFGDSPFWIINSDILCDLNPDPLLKTFSTGRFLSVLWLTQSAGPRTVEMSRGRITEFQSSRPGTDGTYTFCGLQIVSPEIIRYLPEHGFSTIIQAYIRSIEDRRRIAGVCVRPSFWADIGTPDSYLDAHASVLERFTKKLPGGRLFDPKQRAHMMAMHQNKINFSGFAALGDKVIVEDGAIISNSVIWDGAFIASDAIVKNAIVAGQTRVHGRVPKIAMRPPATALHDSQADDEIMSFALRKLKWDPDETTIIPMEPRGSAREFIRLENGNRNMIMIRYSLTRTENALYMQNARFLKQIRWPVPSIVLDVPEKLFAVLEDLGDRSLKSVVETTPLPRIISVYQKVIVAVAKLHGQGSKRAAALRVSLAPPFSADLYRWERELFARHFLERRLNLNRRLRQSILAELAALTIELEREHPVLIHRDLQSSNILLVKGRPFFIDFQGMRFGPAAYDMASLLYDPYVELPIRMQKRLLTLYNEQVISRDRISDETLFAAAIQRLAQALGAYAMLGSSPETAWYGKHIPSGLRMMLIALRHSERCPELQNVVCRALGSES